VYYNNLWSLFSTIDEDGDRRLTRDEFVNAAKVIDLKKDPNEIFAKIDTDKSGMVLFEDVCNYLAKSKSDIGLNDKEDKSIEEKLRKLSKEKEEAKTRFVGNKYKVRKLAQADISKLKTDKMKLPDKMEILRLFRLMDDNASGKVSLAEVDKAVMVLYPDFHHAPALAAAYKSCDASGDGRIEKKEFLFFFHYLVYYNNLWSLFSTIDEDGDRRLTRDEFVNAAKVIDLKKDPNEIFAKIDTDKSGMVLFEDVCNYLATNRSSIGLNDEDIKMYTN